MLSLDGGSRAAVACVALLAFGGAFFTMPSTAQRWAVPTPIAVATIPGQARRRFATVEPRRDPFAGGLPGADQRTTPTASVALPPPQIPAMLSPLPPNPGAPGGLLPFTPAERVSAVVTGAHPVALIDDGATTHLVSVGDRYDGQRVVAIDADGVHLENGATLAVTMHSPPMRSAAGGRQP